MIFEVNVPFQGRTQACKAVIFIPDRYNEIVRYVKATEKPLRVRVMAEDT